MDKVSNHKLPCELKQSSTCSFILIPLNTYGNLIKLGIEQTLEQKSGKWQFPSLILSGDGSGSHLIANIAANAAVCLVITQRILYCVC